MAYYQYVNINGTYYQSNLYTYNRTTGLYSYQYGTPFTYNGTSTSNGIPADQLALLTLYYPSQVACFNKDTQILTDKGYVLIQNLKKGDLVKTLKNGFKPINMIGVRNFYNNSTNDRIKDQLYKCSRDKYPDLFEDLIITGCHCILVDNFKDDKEKQKTLDIHNGEIYITEDKYRVPICASEQSSIYEKSGNHTIYHIALDHDNYYCNYGIFANGLLVESCSKRYLKELSNMILIE
jgi:hypothetical protein